MKKIMILFCFLIHGSFVAIAETPSQKKARMDAIEIFDGEPGGRKFEKISPIWVQSTALLQSNIGENLIKNAKRQAVKVNADAIINFKIETKESGHAFGGNGIFSAAQGATPIATGWAIRWLNNEIATVGE